MEKKKFIMTSDGKMRIGEAFASKYFPNRPKVIVGKDVDPNDPRIKDLKSTMPKKKKEVYERPKFKGANFIQQ